MTKYNQIIIEPICNAVSMQSYLNYDTIQIILQHRFNFLV